MSKLILFDFRCTACDRVSEHLVKPGDYWAQCSHCGANARRELSPVRIDRTRIALTEGASPESVAHFDRVHRERKAQEQRTFEAHGDYGKAAGSD